MLWNNRGQGFSPARAIEVLEETRGGRALAPGRRAATGKDKKRREAVDRIAATIILEDFLQALRAKHQ